MDVSKKFKLLPIGSAVLMFVLGVVIAAISGFANEITILLLMGLGVLAIGVARLVYGWVARKEKDSVPNLVIGGLDAAWGIVAIAAITTQGLFAVLFGVWLLTAGVVELAMSIKYIVERSPFAGIMIDGGVSLIFGVMLFAQNFNNNIELYLLTAAYLFVNTFTSLLVTVLASGSDRPKAKKEAKADELSVIASVKESAETPVQNADEKPLDVDVTYIAPKKPAAKKPAAKKTTTAKSGTAAKKPAAKKPAAKKPAAKKPAETENVTIIETKKE